MTIEEIKQLPTPRERAKAISKLKTPAERHKAWEESGFLGKISAEERAAALRGERIDHHITPEEIDALYGETGFRNFNERATAFDLSGLYSWRRDAEMVDYYDSIAPVYNRYPKGSDCIAYDVDTGERV